MLHIWLLLLGLIFGVIKEKNRALSKQQGIEYVQRQIWRLLHKLSVLDLEYLHKARTIQYFGNACGVNSFLQQSCSVLASSLRLYLAVSENSRLGFLSSVFKLAVFCLPDSIILLTLQKQSNPWENNKAKLFNIYKNILHFLESQKMVMLFCCLANRSSSPNRNIFQCNTLQTELNLIKRL